MSQHLFSDNASTTLASAITSASTTLSVVSGTGSLFPAITTGQDFIFTLQHIVSSVVTAYEICLCTARSTDNFTTIVRAQEGTSAQAWAAGDVVALLSTSGGLNSFIQANQLQAQAGNYAIDTGSANAYSVGLTPALTAHVVGMPIRFLAGNTNTGASTFNDGVGSAALVSASLTALPPNAIIAGVIYTAIYTSTGQFQLASSPATATFIPAWNGFSTNPAPTLIPYTATGTYISINFPVNCYGISNSGTFQISGLPTVICPSAQRAVPVVGMINGGSSLTGVSMAVISPAGTISMFLDGAEDGWAAAGNKGFQFGSSIMYSL
jgi:hypothetical protein